MAVTQINQRSEQSFVVLASLGHNAVGELNVCGETSPAFITWLGEVNLSRGGGSQAGTGSLQYVKSMRGGLQKGVWMDWGEVWKGRIYCREFCKIERQPISKPMFS